LQLLGAFSQQTVRTEYERKINPGASPTTAPRRHHPTMSDFKKPANASKKDFDTAVLITRKFVHEACAPPKPEITGLRGAMVLGNDIYENGKKTADGVGLDEQRRTNLRLGLNHFLRMVGAKKVFLTKSDTKAVTTLNILANRLYDLWP